MGEFGTAQIRPHIKTGQHTEMGISERKDNRGDDVGSDLRHMAIGQTRAHGFVQLEPGVHSDDARAIHVYEKIGLSR